MATLQRTGTNSRFSPRTKTQQVQYHLATWRALLNALAREQVYAQNTEYLERC